MYLIKVILVLFPILSFSQTDTNSESNCWIENKSENHPFAEDKYCTFHLCEDNVRICYLEEDQEQYVTQNGWYFLDSGQLQLAENGLVFNVVKLTATE